MLFDIVSYLGAIFQHIWHQIDLYDCFELRGYSLNLGCFSTIIRTIRCRQSAFICLLRRPGGTRTPDCHGRILLASKGYSHERFHPVAVPGFLICGTHWWLRDVESGMAGALMGNGHYDIHCLHWHHVAAARD